MTEQLPIAGAHSNLNEVTRHCEQLINETQADLALFRNEQIQVRQQVQQAIEENQKLNAQLDALKESTAALHNSEDDATRAMYSKDILETTQKQLHYLEREISELRSIEQCHKKTIQNHELEIQKYRNQLIRQGCIPEISQKYNHAIKLLESSATQQNAAIDEKDKLIKALKQKNELYHERVHTLEEIIKGRTAEFEKMRAKDRAAMEELEKRLRQTTSENKELEKSLLCTQHLMDVRLERENAAMQKVQEALAIAESAISDRDESQNRERIIKEECEQLAATIGQVMDEAAQRVSHDMALMHQKFSEREKSLLEENRELKATIQNAKKQTEMLEVRCTRFEQKYKEAAAEIERQSVQLEETTKALDEFHLTMEQKEQLMKGQTVEHKNFSEEHERQIEQYMKNNQKLKETYRDAMEKFEKEVVNRLKEENCTLRAENQSLKLRLDQNKALRRTENFL